MANEKRLIDANILEERVNQEPTDGMYTHEIVAVIGCPYQNHPRRTDNGKT